MMKPVTLNLENRPRSKNIRTWKEFICARTNEAEPQSWELLTSSNNRVDSLALSLVHKHTPPASNTVQQEEHAQTAMQVPGV